MKIPGKLSGTSPLVSWLNEIRAAILSAQLLPGKGYSVKNASEGQIISMDFGGGGKGTFRWQSPKEHSSTIAVSKDTFVFISPGNILVTTGLIDIDSTVLTYSPPGIWQALIDVPAATGSGYHCPKLMPTTGSNLADSPTLYWALWQEHNPCVGS